MKVSVDALKFNEIEPNIYILIDLSSFNLKVSLTFKKVSQSISLSHSLTLPEPLSV